jgi:glycosyltransferase involved in cell wall biosynthesis
VLALLLYTRPSMQTGEIGTIPATNISNIAKRCGRFLLRPNVPVEVPFSFLAEYGYDNQIQFDFSQYQHLLESRTAEGKLTFDFWCPLSMIDGYGRHALDIYRGLKELGTEPLLRDVGWVSEAYLTGNIRADAMVSRAKPPRKIGVCMSVPYDPHIFSHQAAVKIVITQFETDHFPAKHVEAVNKADHLIVTTSWQPEMMRRSGVKIPISVLTPGVDTEAFFPKPHEDRRSFRCLMLGALTGRKNPLGGLKMFWEASQGQTDWQLLIKSRHADGMTEVRQAARNDHRIEVVVGDTPPEWVPGIYHEHDCLIWPSKGEGCGLPPLEALSCGLEVVSSRNTGMKDFIDEEWAWPIHKHTSERADQPQGGFSQKYIDIYGGVGNWWNPDLKEGARQLRRAYEAWRDGKGKGSKAAEYVRSHHTLRHQAASVLKVVERYS